MPGDSPLQPDRETFSGYIGERFTVAVDGIDGFELELREANRLGGQSDAREPFSLIFRGPLEPILHQAIYTLMHPRLGPLDIFLVPIGPDRRQSGIQYEAVFS